MPADSQTLVREPVTPPADPARAFPAARELAHLLAHRFGCGEVVCVDRAGSGGSLPGPSGDGPYFFWEDDGALLDRPPGAIESLCALAGSAAGGVVTLPAAPSASAAAISLQNLESRLASAGIEIAFSGLTARPGSHEKHVATVVVDRTAASHPAEVPASFRVVVLMKVFNEEDVLDACLSRLTREGVEVLVFDNWSTDRSFEIASSYRGRGVLDVERFPKEGPQPRFALRDILEREEALASRLDADWLLLADADEVRTTPWPGTGLREALYRVERAGFNAVDYTTLVFPPVDDGFQAGTDPETYFRRFEFGSHVSDFFRIGTWRKRSGPASIVASAGHDVAFAGRRVFPYKFFMKHYPVRSQAHGERKVFRERLGRWDPAEHASGWHTHYDHMDPGHRFVRRPEELCLFDHQVFHRDFLAERLTGLGALVPGQYA